MPRLLEFQAKDLLRQCGVPVPQGRAVHSVEEALDAAAEIGFPVAVKAQVLAGKRAEAGGILFAGSPAQATEVARRLLASTVQGKLVETLLVEKKEPIRREIYAAITADPHLRQPVVLLSGAGGTGVEQKARDESLSRSPVDLCRGFQTGEASAIAEDLQGLTEQERRSLAELLARLYDAYRRFDCRLVEINPLAMTDRGLVALDARVEIDDDALFRQAGLGLKPAEEVGGRSPTLLELAAGRIDAADHRGTAHFVQVDPDGSYARSLGKVPIGFDCVGTGASLSLMDELVPLGYYPVNFADTSGNPTASKLYRMTRVILSQPHILGYVFFSCVSSQQLDNTARGIVKALLELYPSTQGKPNMPFLAVFRGAWDKEAIELFRLSGIDQCPRVKVLGRDATEESAAQTFDELYRQWSCVKEGHQ
jgi:succinyl-CoA synthetase beta subunit